LIKKIRGVAVDEEYLLIISMPTSHRLEDDRANDNVLILDSVPQLLMLQHADVFITHAGLNSIKESIYAEVPMLAYPMHPRFDPRGNAARIQYHGLGLKGEVKSTDRETIKNQLHELLTDPKFKVNLKRMKDADQRYTGENFVKLIETTKSLRD
jgi:UDP:flavonoid glycosyltransferase YjiC (YdhE family)